MSKNNRRPDYQAKLPKTDHNLSHKVKFSSSVGHILPVFHHIMNPGENLKVDLSLFSRTQPLVQPAMVDIEENVDFFFVPFPLLYTGFEAKMYGTTDFLSSYFEATAENRPFPLLSTIEDSEFGSTEYWVDLADEVDNGNISATLSASRLLAHLKYNFMMPFNGTEFEYEGQIAKYSDAYMPRVFPYALLAYHAIYYDFFSLQDFESRVVSNYNWDRYSSASYEQAHVFPSNFWKLHYCAYDGDYFTNTYPTPLLSTANIKPNMLDNSQFNNALRLYLGDGSSVYAADNLAQATSQSDFMQVSSDGDSAFTLATNQLRANFAVEKYLRVLGRADKTYDAQILAHFGFKVPTDVKHQVQHIGHHSQEIKIGEVVATAQTYDGESGASLGDIAGKGYGNGGRQNMVDFTAPVHGVVMAVFYAKPKQVYNRYGFDRINWITGPESFWNEEFDALGAQPLFTLEAQCPIDYPWAASEADIWSWEDRYHEFKHKYSWATPAFASTLKEENEETKRFNVWNTWINGQSPLRYDLNRSVDVDKNLKGRLVMPSDLNNIFTVDFVSQMNEAFVMSPWLMYQGDPFIHDLTFNITLWSPMSKTGESRLDF